MNLKSPFVIQMGPYINHQNIHSILFSVHSLSLQSNNGQQSKKDILFPPKTFILHATIIISFVQQVNTMLFTPILLENN